jgi:formylglycine-generating enzyme required for sulfatase activity
LSARDLADELYQQFERFLETQESPWFSMESWLKTITTYSPSPDHAAVCVSWPLADSYCRWLTMRAVQFHAGSNETAVFAQSGFRLPMEVEWEYACRASTTTAFGFGSSFNIRLIYWYTPPDFWK